MVRCYRLGHAYGDGMVKSETFFCRLIAIDTLIAFDGIITSAADFQLKLVSLIEQFNKAMLAENHEQTECETLCQILCCYFDQRLTHSDRGDLLSWQRYSLKHYFYGYGENSDNISLIAQVESVLQSSNEVIFSYAWKLLMLLQQTEGETESIVALRTAHRARYYSRLHTNGSRVPVQPAPLAASQGDADSPQLMMLIIGPFARKWFAQYDLSSGDNGRVVWIVAEHVQILVDRLAHIKNKHPYVAMQAFFPLLADGCETSSVMIEQIAAWQYALTMTQLSETVPCILGLYTRLSQQRFSHDPDQAIWNGRVATTISEHLSLEMHLVNLICELDACDKGNDFYALQRYSLGSALVAWLAEQRIMRALQNLFDSTPLQLIGVMLADHGLGFTRHGAWSLWLAEKYTIVPGLSASITLPPLPDIPLSLLTEPRPKINLALVAPPPSGKRHWPYLAASLALVVSFTAGIHYYLEWKTGGLNATSHPIALPLIGLEQENPPARSLFFTTKTVPLFEKGSSALVAGSENALEEVVKTIKQEPLQIYLIIGHADNTGSPELNKTLSVERAKTMRRWLSEKSGLPLSHFIVEGAGNSRPIASNDTQEGRSLNRRVEIIPLPIQDNQGDKRETL